jgi:hypothetical protein
MPGPRNIDTRQHSADRSILKRNTILTPTTQANTVNLDTSNFALKTLSLSQFASTTSDELSKLILDETGAGSLVFNISPILYTPQIDTVSRIITSEVTTGSTTANQVLMSFPLYEGNAAIGLNSVIGSADVIIQTDVGDTTGTAATPEYVTKRRISKMLIVMDHDFNGIGGSQSPYLEHTEYGHTATASGVATYNFAYRSATKTFNIEVTPSTNNTMRHRVIAFCMFGMDRNWSAPPVVVP